MDFSRNAVLKENYTFFVGDSDGSAADSADGGERGLYDRDTRYLSRYAWSFGDGVRTLLAFSPRLDRLRSHHGHLEGHGQLLGVRRDLDLADQLLHDRLAVENSSRDARSVALALELATDFADLFEVRGWGQLERPGIEAFGEGASLGFRYRDPDGAVAALRIAFDPVPDEIEVLPGGGRRVHWRRRLDPQEQFELTVDTTLSPPERIVAAGAEPIPYPAWRSRFGALRVEPRHRPALERAIDDLRGLLLFTEQGPIPAAGIPWFVAAFGRDALLTALMTLPHAPEMAAGTLRYLASLQGSEHDARSAEAPGKIPHEMRFGELTRSGKAPFGPYYGTVDATPLWIVLLHRLWRSSGDLALVRELRPALEAALGWMVDSGDLDGDGFLEFRGARREGGEMTGLSVQSWKDSADSMSHADGTLAHGDIAVSEVQGYAWDAYRGAAELLTALGDDAAARPWQERAERLQRDFQAAFWLDDEGTYALALDGAKRPLRVHNSDAGQLLWSGIVPAEIAPRLAATLFDERNWSGWGIRTLGASEARYSAVSYHIGSVWPHDSALIAGGLARYGFHAEAARLRDAIFELASAQPDLRPPELVAGYPREAEVPPVPYPVACRPQAWDAAALVYLAGLAPES